VLEDRAPFGVVGRDGREMGLEALPLIALVCRVWGAVLLRNKEGATDPERRDPLGFTLEVEERVLGIRAELTLTSKIADLSSGCADTTTASKPLGKNKASFT
jgi:hypothetical protein